MKTLFHLSGFAIAFGLLVSYLDHTHPDITLGLLAAMIVWGVLYLFIGD